VQEYGCWALMNIGWSDKAVQGRIRGAGAVGLVEAALRSFPQAQALQQRGAELLAKIK
jgi:hypothetical protein